MAVNWANVELSLVKAADRIRGGARYDEASLYLDQVQSTLDSAPPSKERRHWRARSLSLRGVVRRDRGEVLPAISDLMQARWISIQEGSLRDSASLTIASVTAYLNVDNPAGARQLLALAMTDVYKAGDMSLYLECKSREAALLEQEGHVEQALLIQVGEVVPLSREMEPLNMQAARLNAQARMHLGQENPRTREVERSLSEAESYLSSDPHPIFQAVRLATSGEYALAIGDIGEAETVFREATSLLRTNAFGNHHVERLGKRLDRAV